MTILKCLYKKRLEGTTFHHHHVLSPTQISRTLLFHTSLSYIAFCRSSRLHLLSVHSCCRLVLTECPKPAHPCEGTQRRTSLMNLLLLLQQCPACLVQLLFCMMLLLGFFIIAHSILVQLSSSFFLSPHPCGLSI